jgi:hypothetical protein
MTPKECCHHVSFQAWIDSIHLVDVKELWNKRCHTISQSSLSHIWLILFGIKKNCIIRGRILLLYLFTRRVIKLTVVIIVGYRCYQLLFKILHSRLSPYVEEITGDNQYGFQCNRSNTDQIFYICQIVGKKIGVQRDSTSAIHRLQESLWVSWEGSKYCTLFTRVWGTHETS